MLLRKNNSTGPFQSRDPTGQSHRRGRKLSLGGKLLRLLFGLVLGLLLSELLVYLYFEQLIWLPLATPPKYDLDRTAVRLAVLGGSTSKGIPYSGAVPADFGRPFTLLSTTQLLLDRRFGYSNVEVDLYAEGGYPIENAVKCYWQTAEYKPDVMVLYSGHNEWGYYSSNMTPPLDFLPLLRRTNTGSLLLRDLFRRQSHIEDSVYHGKLFSDNIFPSYEATFNKARYKNYVERVIKHCRSQEIFLILVVPEGNYLFPPTRSVYHGPLAEKDQALKRFKQAFYYKHFKQDLDRARLILEELSEFCSFADLYFELGEIYYRQGETKRARQFLRQARNLDEYPPVIPPEYQQILRELAQQHDVPQIDLSELITQRLGLEIPDYSCFVDNCHFKPQLYEALAAEIIRILRDHQVADLQLPEKDLTIQQRERAEYLGLTEDRIVHSWARAHLWVAEEAGETFLKLPRLENSMSFFRDLQSAPPPAVLTKFVDDTVIWLEEEIESERARLLQWIRAENELAID